MTREKENDFLVQGSILAAASIIVRLIGMIYRIPMQRIIGDEGMGYYGYAYEIYNIALILSSYSLPLAVSKLVATRTVKREHKNAYRIFLAAMGLAITVGLAASLIVFFGADFFASRVLNSPNSALPLKVLAPTIFVFSIMGVLRGYFQGKNTMIPTSISQILEQVINALVSIGASYFLIRNFSASFKVASYGAAGGTLGTLVGAIVSLGFLVFVFLIYKTVLNRQLRRDTTNHVEPYGHIFKILLITISPIIISQTVYQVSGIIDGTMFGHIMANKKIPEFAQEVVHNYRPGQLYNESARGTLMGIYGNKYRLLTNIPVGIASAIGAAIIPSIAMSLINEDFENIKNKIHSAIKFNMIIAIPSAVGIGVLAGPILQLIFRDSFALSANVLRLGSIAIIFFAFSTVTNAILQGINKLYVPVIHSAISLVIHIVILFVLLKFTNLGIYALVIGNISFALLVSILNAIYLARNFDYNQEIKISFMVPGISAIGMGLAAWISHKGFMIISKSNTVATLLALLIAIVVYFVLLIMLKGISQEELMNLPKGHKIVALFNKIGLFKEWKD